jgi:hypothetical protein
MVVREVSRVLDKTLKLLIVTFEDDFGARHIHQERLMVPRFMETADGSRVEVTTEMLRDWTEANVENARITWERQTSEFVDLSGCFDAEKRAAVEDPLAGYKGCCG